MDLFGGMLKPLVFGATLALVSCYCGLRTHGGTQGVGRSTTQAGRVFIVLILIFDLFLTRLILAIHPMMTRDRRSGNEGVSSNITRATGQY